MNTLTIEELATYLDLSERTLFRMIADGRFPVSPIAGLRPRRWNVEDVDKWRGVK